MDKCKECNHRHGSHMCGQIKKDKSRCRCISHSGKHDGPRNFKPKAHKRSRMIQSMLENSKAKREKDN